MGNPYGAGLSQLVIDGPHVYVSGPEIPARRLTRVGDGWEEQLIVPADCRRKGRIYELPIGPLPAPLQPHEYDPVEG